MTLKTRFLAAAAALALPALAAAQQPTPPASGPAATQPRPSATTPPARQQQDATETEAQQPENSANAQPPQQSAQTPPAPTPPATTPAPGAQASTTPPAPTPPASGGQAGTTPPSAPVPPGALVNATTADLRVGAQVHDQQGGLVGTIETSDAAGAVVDTGTAKGRLALASFGRNSRGLVIGMNKVQLEAAIRAATPSAAAAPGATTSSNPGAAPGN